MGCPEIKRNEFPDLIHQKSLLEFLKRRIQRRVKQKIIIS